MKRTKFSLLKLKIAALFVCTSVFLTACNFFYFGDNSSQTENNSTEENNSSEEKNDNSSSNNNNSSSVAINSNIYGEWKSSWGETYSITENDYDNYYSGNLSYSTTNIVIVPIDDTKGFIYGQFDDEDHLGYGATINQWYALYYDNLTSSSVSFYQPYKAGGKAGCDTLAEAKTEYTIDNGYFNFESPSECTK
ncbi:MAG: hypothetical protein K5866_00580 [Treponema sp.]|nr:hypothetical protein [Treponema sp.]